MYTVHLHTVSNEEGACAVRTGGRLHWRLANSCVFALSLLRCVVFVSMLVVPPPPPPPPSVPRWQWSLLVVLLAIGVGFIIWGATASSGVPTNCNCYSGSSPIYCGICHNSAGCSYSSYCNSQTLTSYSSCCPTSSCSISEYDSFSFCPLGTGAIGYHRYGIDYNWQHVPIIAMGVSFIVTALVCLALVWARHQRYQRYVAQHGSAQAFAPLAQALPVGQPPMAYPVHHYQPPHYAQQPQGQQQHHYYPQAQQQQQFFPQQAYPQQQQQQAAYVPAPAYAPSADLQPGHTVA